MKLLENTDLHRVDKEGLDLRYGQGDHTISDTIGFFMMACGVNRLKDIAHFAELMIRISVLTKGISRKEPTESEHFIWSFSHGNRAYNLDIDDLQAHEGLRIREISEDMMPRRKWARNARKLWMASVLSGRISGFLPFDDDRETQCSSVSNVPYRITASDFTNAEFYVGQLIAQADVQKGKKVSDNIAPVSGPFKGPEDMDAFLDEQSASMQRAFMNEVFYGMPGGKKSGDFGQAGPVEEQKISRPDPGDERNNSGPFMHIHKRSFLQMLSEEDKNKLVHHFGEAYDCHDFGEKECNLAYFAWLWHLGVVGEDEYGLTWVHESMAEFDPADLEWPLHEGDTEEVFDPNVVYDTYGLSKIPSLLDWHPSESE